MSERLPTASVIVNTYNRARYLPETLKGLQQLDYPELEVVVVNGPSTDGSSEVLAAWGSAIKALSCPAANLSTSRNVGLAAAAGEIVAFVDDDAVPHPQWLKRLARVYRDETVGGVGGFTRDNTGVGWQVRKTVCDRYGAAYPVPDFFDERPLNVPGSPFYPSLLGTNSSFRAAAVREIGGFDETFAYLLDETDVCLRLVDAGWRVVYEPGAEVFHQFAPSHIRSADRVARTLLPSATSKAYFIMRHGARGSVAKAGEALERYREEIGRANRYHAEEGAITEAHRHSLDQDLFEGTECGLSAARMRGDRREGDLAPGEPPPFVPFPRSNGLRIALVSQGFPPGSEAGIARWSWMVAHGLAERGHKVHVITRADREESVGFAGGLWLHRVKPDGVGAAAVAEVYDLPSGHADWSARVMREVDSIKAFGLDLVSFPIWDLEALPVVDDPDVASSVSLHTTYAMAKPFKPEWSARPLYEHYVVDKVIAAEGALLVRARNVLGNSRAIVDGVREAYGVTLGERCRVVPHGTPDPLLLRRAQAEARTAAMTAGDPLRVLFVGRFEPRKGVELAARTAALLSERDDVGFRFVGDDITDAFKAMLDRWGVPTEGGNVEFAGLVDRAALDHEYVDADIVLMPSRFESFGLVAIEAMAAGRPVLGLASGGLSEIIEDGVNGLSWPDGDEVVSEIARAVGALAADRSRLRAMGEAARRTYERRFTLETMVDGIEAYFQERVDDHRGGVRVDGS